jgi:hypothetical protein
MTFLDLDCDAADLAVELWFNGDAETLDAAATMVSDIRCLYADFACEWDMDSFELQLAAAFAKTA